MRKRKIAAIVLFFEILTDVEVQTASATMPRFPKPIDKFCLIGRIRQIKETGWIEFGDIPDFQKTCIPLAAFTQTSIAAIFAVWHFSRLR